VSAVRVRPPAPWFRETPLETAEGVHPRVLFLDAFRGFVIASMLLVNNMVWNANTPGQLMHAPWAHGVTFTDMILPWFVFTMGVAIPLSAAGQGPSGHLDPRRLLLKVFRRAAVLVALGILLVSLENHRMIVGMDVLQLLGLAYLVGALLSWMPTWARLAASGVLFAAHWALLALVPVPGYGAGVFEEQHNIISYLDDTYLAHFHLNHPAGVILAIPASALVLIGTSAGDLLRTPSVRQGAKFGVFVLAGSAVTLGGILWGYNLPLNKFLWTPSYALLAGGLGLLVLGIFYFLVDIVRVRALGLVFAIFGSNAILAYIAPIVFHVQVLEAWRVRLPSGQTITLQAMLIEYLTRTLGGIGAIWVYTGTTIVLWWLGLLYLYQKRIIVRV
jgi:predicted acyltransferase